MPRFEVELAVSHGMRLDVSKRERFEQTVCDPILALFAHMQLRLLTPGFLQRSLLVLCFALNNDRTRLVVVVTIVTIVIRPCRGHCRDLHGNVLAKGDPVERCYEVSRSSG
jgi:hypothetical protein